MRKSLASLSLAVSLAACGSDANQNGGPADASAVDGASIGPVTVQVVLGQGPLSGAHVLFSDPGGGQISLVDTDSTGHATAQVPIHSSVTTVFTTGGIGSAFQLYTVMDIAPGDNLILGVPAAATPVIYGTANFTVADRAGTTAGYSIYDGCSSSGFGEPPGTTPAGLQVDDRCADAQGRFAAVATAYDSTNTVVGFSTLTNLQMNADAGVFTTSSTFNQGWFGPTGNTMVSLQGSPATGWAGVIVDVYYLRNGIFYYDDVRSFTPTTFMSQVTMPVSASFFNSQIDSIFVSYPITLNHRPNQIHFERNAVGATSLVSYDNFLPKVHDSTVGVAGGRVTYGFTSEGPIGSAHGALARVNWRETPDGGASGPVHTWTIVFPPATSVTTPPLPGAFDAWSAQMGNATFPGTGSGASVQIVQSTAIGSYAVFRANAARASSFAVADLPSGNFSLYTTGISLIRLL